MLPTINLKRVLTVQSRLSEAVTQEFFACTPAGPAFHDLVALVMKQLPKADPGAVAGSLQSSTSRALDDAAILELSWRLAGNLRKLQAGTAVGPWSYQAKPEWVPVEVRGVYLATKVFGKKGGGPADAVRKKGARLRFLVLAGSPAGHRFERFLSSGFLHRIRADIGFSKFDRERYSTLAPRHPCFPLHHLTEFTQTRFFVQLAAGLPQAEVTFTAVKGASGMVTANRDLFLKRRRTRFPCPLAYDVAVVPCHTCPAGYDRCEAACHPRTYAAKPCARCGKTTYHDREACTECAARGH